MSNKPLRFAALIRVSSEKQERRGESLQTQSSQIEQAVAALGGKITARYAGQEHATPGWEREQLEMLLRDASKPRKKFVSVRVGHRGFER
jgi:DNA invertase Pin-like site-specific DNA recombinase